VKKILKLVSKIISSTLFVILLFIMIFLLAYVVRVKILANNNDLGEVKLNFYTILSPSMYPTIKPGDIIVTYKEDAYYKGDIITFVSSSNVSSGKTITHRIYSEPIEMNGKMQYTTKGDNNPSPDSAPANEDNVLGKVLFKIPKAGYIQQFLLSKIGWVTVILLPCIGVVIYDILKIFKIAGKKTKSAIKKNARTDVAREELIKTLNEEQYDKSEKEDEEK
jgi:signal peptidase I